MSRAPIPTWFFALVVVRKGDHFLLVQERKHDQLWYIPAGRAEQGESLAEAAERETLEESGIPVRLTGVIRVEHSPVPTGARVRAIFLAEPAADVAPKSEPDKESLRAAWVSLADLADYPLRGPEVATLLRWVAAGGAIAPLSILAPEHEPFRQERSST